MKKIVFMLFSTLCILAFSSEQGRAANDMHNAQNSLDYAGTYTGTLPSRHGNMEVVLTLNSDMTYSFRATYPGTNRAPRQIEGKFTWLSGGSVIELNKNRKESKFFFVAENALLLMDKKARRIQDDPYRLEKKLETMKSVSTGRKISLLVERRWKVVEFDGKPVVRNPDFLRDPFLIFGSNNSMVHGNTGCNILNGPYKLNGKSLTFGNLMTTMMACPNYEFEGAFLRMFDKVASFRVEGEKMELLDGDSNVLARFVEAPQE